MSKVVMMSLSVFCGCCISILFLELLVKEDPGCGNLVTFSQFFTTAVIGFIFTSKFDRVNAKIEKRDYIILVVMFFAANICNNYAFNLNISMPLVMIFKSGSLVANMIMGIIILKKKYNLDKYISVALITLGVLLCTVVSGSEVVSVAKKALDNPQTATETTKYEDFFWWIVGISCLTYALFLTARMSVYLETMFKKHGKYPNEALYYTHLLLLPGFVLLSVNLWEHFKIAVHSRPLLIPIINVNLPCIIVYLFVYVVMQFMCVSSVYHLMAECSALAVTLVLTLSKFISLIFSILYFRNPFTVFHWIGTFLVFVGTVIFTELPQKVTPSQSLKQDGNANIRLLNHEK